MRSLDDLRFIAARVLAEVRATPPTGPLLGTDHPVGRPRAEVCMRGHEGAGRDRQGHCRACRRERRRERL